MQEKVVALIAKAKKYIEANGGLKAVYFVGCGGSLASSQTGYCFVEYENKSGLAVGHVNSNEFVHCVPGVINKNAIVIVTSMKATAESVMALKIAQGKKAYTIAITGNDDTLMARTADDYIVYTHSENWTCAMHSQAISLRIGVEIIKQFEGLDIYDGYIKAIDSLNDRYDEVKKKFTRRAVRFSTAYKEENLYHVFGTGAMYGATYGACYCHLMEMQQLNAIPINCTEYVHGFFESTTPNQPSIIFMNVGKMRALDERCLNFLKDFCEKLVVLDAREYGLDDIDESIAMYIAPLITSPLFRFYVEHLAIERKHPMTLRRYMWQFDY